VRNSIAAQEFGSDYTHTYDVRGVSLAWSLARFGWRPSLEAAYERHAPLFVHAQPATGAFRAPRSLLSGFGRARVTLGLDRPTSLVPGGFRVGRSYLGNGRSSQSPIGGRIETAPAFSGGHLEKPFGSNRVLLRTIAAGVLGHDSIPVQHLVFLGVQPVGPATISTSLSAEPAEPKAGMALSRAVSSRYHSAGTERRRRHHSRAVPTAVWIDRSAAFKDLRQGWYPTWAWRAHRVRRHSARRRRGLRGGRWTFRSIGRDFLERSLESSVGALLKLCRVVLDRGETGIPGICSRDPIYSKR